MLPPEPASTNALRQPFPLDGQSCVVMAGRPPGLPGGRGDRARTTRGHSCRERLPRRPSRCWVSVVRLIDARSASSAIGMRRRRRASRISSPSLDNARRTGTGVPDSAPLSTPPMSVFVRDRPSRQREIQRMRGTAWFRDPQRHGRLDDGHHRRIAVQVRSMVAPCGHDHGCRRMLPHPAQHLVVALADGLVCRDAADHPDGSPVTRRD